MFKAITGSPLFLIGGIVVAAVGGWQFYQAAIVPHIQHNIIGRFGK